MARTTKKGNPSHRSGKAKPAKSVPRKNANVPRKAARKAPAKASKARKPGKAARPTPKRRPATRALGGAAHAARMKEVRQRVARRRPGMAPLVDHEQQDPSIVPPPAPPVPPVDQLRQNWGDTKEKAVTRLDKPTNWYRQAAKPPAKK